MNNKMTRLFTLLFLLLMPINHVIAQNGNYPLIFIRDGYLFSWTNGDGTLQLTDEGYVSDLAMSPDNTAFAFLQRDREAINMLNFDLGQALPFVSICIMNSTSFDLGCLPDTVSNQNPILRYHLKWLPDNRLIWGEYDGDERMVYYDPVSGTRNSEAHDSIISDAGNFGFQEYNIWQNHRFRVGSGSSGEFVARIVNYPVVGETYYATILAPDYPSSESLEFLSGGLIVGHETDYIGLLNLNGDWYWLDTDNRTESNMLAVTYPFEQSPDLRLHTEPENALRWRIDGITLNDRQSFESIQWEFFNRDRISPVVEKTNYQWRFFGIDPGGAYTAYLDEDGIHIYDIRGSDFLIPDTGEISDFVWGAIGWYEAD